MQHRIIYNKFIGSWVFSSLMVIATTGIADNYGSQSFPQYSQQVTGAQSNPRQTNPWALPEKQERKPYFQQSPKHQGQQYQDQRYQGQQYQDQRYQGPQYQDQRYQEQQYQGQRYQDQQYQGQQYQDNQTDKQSQGFGFVTPEIIESLKRQQTQHQLMPENQQNQRYMQQQPSQGYYGYQPYGMGYSNPMYNAPAVSPWGSGPGLLYRGQSFPLVPNEAIGGIPPIHVPSIGEESYLGDTNDAEKQKEFNVFNPFTFLQDGR